MKAADVRYKELGSKSIRKYVLYKQGKGGWFTITELYFYKSKQEETKVEKKAEKDPRIKFLFSEFLKVVRGKKFIEEDFELIK